MYCLYKNRLKRNHLAMINSLTVHANQVIAARLVKINQKVVGIKNRLKRNHLVMINSLTVHANQAIAVRLVKTSQ